MRYIFACCLLFALTEPVHATGRSYPDIHVRSPSGRYQVDATSPDNQGDGFPAFQSSFTYKCVDTKSGKTLWTRNQPMGKPERLSEDSDIEFALPEEGSPESIFVSDRGTTLIYNAEINLIVVSPEGKDVGTVELFEDAFTKEECEQYVCNTTAGPWWRGLSLWYYLDSADGELFVVRPWWGRRIYVDVQKGKLTPENKKLKTAALAREKQLVLATLSSKEEPSEYELSKYDAAYLAGVLKLKQAIPFLKTVEDSAEISSWASRNPGFEEDYNNEVNPHNFSTYGLRQVAQLSLRRLGVAPRNLPCTLFELQDGDETLPFIPAKLKTPRHGNVERVTEGMTARQVLDTIGAPDYVGDYTWSYDMDATPPYTLILTFDEKKVTAIKQNAPLWKSGMTRDQILAF